VLDQGVSERAERKSECSAGVVETLRRTIFELHEVVKEEVGRVKDSTASWSCSTVRPAR
jgi:hypothetical protein